MPVAALDGLDRVLVVGSLLRKEHPLLAQRLRQAAKKGAQVSFLNPVDDDPLLKVRHSLVAPPSLMPLALSEIVVAAARAAGQPVPPALNSIEPREAAEAIAASLAGAKAGAVLLGNLAEQHADASQLLALAQELARLTGATLGCLGEAANSVGGHLADALPRSGGLERGADAHRAAARVPRRSASSPSSIARIRSPRARRSKRADFVVVLSPFRHGAGLRRRAAADRAVHRDRRHLRQLRGPRAVVQRRRQARSANARPAWKVLRVLGSMLELPGFAFETHRGRAARRCRSAADLAARPRATALRSASTGRLRAGGRHRARRRRSDLLRRPARASRAVAAADGRRAAAAGADERAHAAAARRRRRRAGAGAPGPRRGGAAAVEVDAAVPPGVVRIAAAHPSTVRPRGPVRPDQRGARLTDGRDRSRPCRQLLGPAWPVVWTLAEDRRHRACR